MSDLRQCSRQFLTEFIELYKSLPCLWRVKTKEYSDRDKKTKAYETMVRKFREVDPNASRDTVTKKINSLRSVYRKEVMKINRSIQLGAVGGDVYTPSIWYFDMFSFLRDQENPKDVMVEYIGIDNDSSTAFCDIKQEVDEVEVDMSDLDASSYTPETDATMHPGPQEDWASTIVRDCSCRSSRKRQLPLDKRLDAGPDRDPLRVDDSFDTFGKHVANKLRTLTAHQNIFAMKLINDVLFEAEMQTLDRRSAILTSAGIPPQQLASDGRHC